jgi:hypothetical protein
MNIIDLAEVYNLQWMEVTQGRNGYPMGLYKAISSDNFDSFKELEEFANENNLSIVSLHKRDGWDLWENRGTMYKPYSNSAEDFGDNYSEFHKMNEEQFFEQEIHPVLEDISDFDSLEDFLKCKKQIWEEIEAMEEDEIVLTHEGNYSETLKQESLSFSHDTHNYKIALIEE